MTFADHQDALDQAVIDHLADGEALLYPAAGGDPLTVHPLLDRRLEEFTLDRAKAARPRPAMSIARLELPGGFHHKDEVVLNGNRWRAAETATAADDGRWWVAEVSDLGPVT
jgi:hypothetical protein